MPHTKTETYNPNNNGRTNSDQPEVVVIDVSPEYPHEDHTDDQHCRQDSKPAGCFWRNWSWITFRKMFKGIPHSHTHDSKFLSIS